MFVVCAVVYGALSSYPRELAVYSDELRYLDVARSLWQGRDLRVRNMPSDYQKILYPLFHPACSGAENHRRTNYSHRLAERGVCVQRGVPQAYALCRATGQNRRRTVFLVGVVALLPTMSAAVTFMSETVFLPLSLWQIHFMLRAMQAAPKAQVGWCAAAGVWCYLLYLNKEVALYYLIAWVLVRAWALWQARSTWRSELACNVALFGSFAVCFVLAKLTLFRGLGNSYNQTGWLTAEQWGFLPFAIVCDVLFTVLAFGVFPCCCPPQGCASRPRAATRCAPSCRCFCYCRSSSVWGSSPGPSPCGRTCTPPAPAAHAVSGPLFMPLLLVALNTLDEQLSATRRRVLAALTAVWGVGFIAFCRAIGAGARDNTLLQWFDFVADRLDRLPVLGLNGWLLVWRCIIVVGAAVIGALLLRRKAGGPWLAQCWPSVCCATQASGASTAGPTASMPKRCRPPAT